MNIRAIGGYKGVSGESKEISSGKIGPVEEAILNYCAFNGSRFKAAYVVNWIMEKGLTKGLNGESSRLKLLKRVHDAIQRLARRGLVKKLAHGFYMLTASVEELASKLKPARAPSLIKGSKETDGTRVPAGGGGGCGVGLFLDNLRGYNSGGYVNGDRGRVRSLSDLVFFDSVSYFEPSVGVGSGFFDGLGQAVVYFSCVDVPGCGVVCGDRPEWRPPHDFVKEHGVVGTLDVFVSKVIPVAFALWGRAGVVVGTPFDVMARYLRALAPSLYEYIAGRGG